MKRRLGFTDGTVVDFPQFNQSPTADERENAVCSPSICTLAFVQTDLVHVRHNTASYPKAAGGMTYTPAAHVQVSTVGKVINYPPNAKPQFHLLPDLTSPHPTLPPPSKRTRGTYYCETNSVRPMPLTKSPRQICCATKHSLTPGSSAHHLMHARRTMYAHAHACQTPPLEVVQRTAKRPGTDMIHHHHHHRHHHHQRA